MSIIVPAAALIWILGLLGLAGSAALACAQPALMRRRDRSPARPPVSVVVPLKADSEGLAAATESLLALDYPAYDVTMCAAESPSAAMDRVRILLPAGRSNWHFLTNPPASDDRPTNPKVANLTPAVLGSKGLLILIKDAETVLDRDSLRCMAALMAGDVGLVVAVPIGRKAEGLAGATDAAFLNGYGARLVLAASTLGIGVGLGAAMLVRRADLLRSQGLAAMAASIADDHALALALSRAGLRTVCAERPVWQGIGRRRPVDVWQRHLRWAICRRTAAPAAFLAEPLASGAIATVSGALAAPAFGAAPLALAALTALAWISIETGLALAKGWPVPPLMPLAILAREAMLPALWLAALAARHIAWGDRLIAIDGVRRPRSRA